jgi:hypothetical protein
LLILLLASLQQCSQFTSAEPEENTSIIASIKIQDFLHKQILFEQLRTYTIPFAYLTILAEDSLLQV